MRDLKWDRRLVNAGNVAKPLDVPKNLNRHQQIYIGEKSYKCRECGKGLRQSSHLFKD